MIYLIVALVALVLANLLLLGYTFHKVRRIHVATFGLSRAVQRLATHDLADLWRQVQALDELRAELRFTAALPLTRGWAASPDFLLVVAQHALQAKPEVAVECGSGTSTIVLARCLQLNGRGHLYSLDHDGDFAEETRRNLERHGLAEWATIVHAPLRPHGLPKGPWPWYSEERLDPYGLEGIDMLVIDGPPLPVADLARYPAGPILLPRLRPKGAVFLDDAGRPDEKQIVALWQAAFPALAGRSHPTEKGCVSLHLP